MEERDRDALAAPVSADSESDVSRRAVLVTAAATIAAGLGLADTAEAQVTPPFLSIARLIQEPKLTAKCGENCGCNEACGCKDKPNCCEQKCACDQKGALKFPDALELARNPKFLELVGKFTTDEIKTIADFTGLVTKLGTGIGQ